MIVYFNGEFMPKEEAAISPDDRGFLFGDGAYEVIRTYEGKPFRGKDHLERLARSLRELRISCRELENLGGIAERLIRETNLETGEALVYIEVTRGAAPRKHAFPTGNIPPTVYVTASPFVPSGRDRDLGIGVILLPDIRWSRCDIKSIALLPNVLANQQAGERGAGEALFVREGVVTEGSHTNFCAVFDGELVTHPQTNHILPGITRKVVLELCSELEIPFREEPIFLDGLKRASELMIVGTTCEVTPVVQVEEWRVGDGSPGPVTRRLQQAFSRLATA
ncbi:MAG: D-amino acid aminotransferase [Deltaproteobacteria bacterium]|nr:D-amino acid aminotransferase [Deltaproteobacteria bacterium]